MRAVLKLHPDCTCAAVSSIEAEVERVGPELRIRYVARGRMSDVLVPAPSEFGRADGLWNETCFEAFVRGRGEAYCEFNFAPSTRWAAYAFEGYRAGKRDFEVAPHLLEMRSGQDWFELDAVVTPGQTGPWSVGLSAVIEEVSGAKSYWALTHAPGKPDFHNAKSFALEFA
ncbi:MAG: DOMON-like domain-containing protein [Hyphomonadaceae bacterium]